MPRASGLTWSLNWLESGQLRQRMYRADEMATIVDNA